MKPIIECNDISKVYKKNGAPNSQTDGIIHALKNVSFTLNEGDRLGLLGLNGSGKSTLLKIISGYIKPSSGSIQLNKNVSSLSGFDSMLHPDLNAVENCKLQLQILGFKKREIPSLITSIITFSELEEFAYQPIKTFSSGMMLRLSFSIFTVTKPEILLLDEVFSSGDIKFQQKASLIMHQTFSKLPAVIIASHQLNEIKEFCNKCLILDKGKVVFSGTVDQAMKIYHNENVKSETVNYTDQITLVESSISDSNIKISESATIKIKLRQHSSDLDINPAIYISNEVGKIMTDSPVYCETYKQKTKEAGTYIYEVEIASNLLNEGIYYVSIYFGSKNSIYLKLLNHFTLQVNTNEWEIKSGWNIPTDYPIRTRLNWEINKC